MKHALLILLFLIFASPARSELSWSAGVGLQYGGFMGAQASYQLANTKLRASLGVVGVSAGLEQLLTENISIGYQSFAVGFTSGWGFFCNYYFPEKNNRRVIVGIDYLRRSEYAFITSEGENNNSVLISFGYAFK